MSRPVTAATVLIVLGAARMQTPHHQLAAFTENEVTVRISETDSAGQTWVVASFTPTRPQLHLYGKDLPRHGLRGIGRPTLLELAPASEIQPSGPVVADRQPQDLFVPTLNLTFPVYPAGPVTLQLPVTSRTPGEHQATLSLTYMACDQRVCFPPVLDKQVVVHVAVAHP